MKKKVDWAVFLIFIISIFLALKYSTLPVWSNVPQQLQNWFVMSNVELTEYVFFYDLFIGIVVSCIFYFFVEFIPSKIHTYESKKLLSYELDLLLRDMNFIICTIKHIFQIEMPTKYIFEKDILIVNGKTNIQKNGMYLEQIYHSKGIKKGRKVTAINTDYAYPQCISNVLKNISDRVDNISKKESFYSIDLKFAETIILLRDNKFIDFYRTGVSHSCFLLADTNRGLIEFINLYRILLKLNYHSKYSTFNYLTDEEINNRPNALQNFFELCERVNSKIIKLNPCVIYNDLSYNSQIIVNQLDTRIFENKIYSYPLDIVPNLNRNNMVVVILGTGFLKQDKSFNEYLSKIDFTGKQVVIFKEYIFIKNNKGLDVINGKSIAKKIFYFKSSLKLKLLYINKEYPTPNNIAKINKNIHDFVDNFVE